VNELEAWLSVFHPSHRAAVGTSGRHSSSRGCGCARALSRYRGLADDPPEADGGGRADLDPSVGPNAYNLLHADDYIDKILSAWRGGKEPLAVNFGGSDVTSVEEWTAYIGELTGLTPIYPEE